MGSVSFYQNLVNAHSVTFEKHEHFIKQTWRNRCAIAGPNGKQILVIPVIKGKSGHTPVKDVRICNDTPWQKIHWRSLEAGYRRSPYFEYYEDDLRPLFGTREEFLLDFNLKLHDKIMKFLKTKKKTGFTDKYNKHWDETEDLRDGWISAGSNKYVQVFSARNGFVEGLSIVDLIFNEGPVSTSYLTC